MNYLEAQILQTKLWAEWHIASATTGHCKSNKIYKSMTLQEAEEYTGKTIAELNPEIYKRYDGEIRAKIELSDEDKINDVMNTAKQHIQNLFELMQHLPPAKEQ